MFIYDKDIFLAGNFQATLFTWLTKGTVAPPPVTKANWYFAYPLLFEGVLFDWSPGAVSQLGGFGGITGGGSSTGNLQFVFQGPSLTNGSVTAFNDGKINVPLITITRATYPIVQACINILKDVGKAGQSYKLDVIRNGVTLFTVRSVLWGTIMATNTDPNYQIIDNQLQATTNPPL